MVSTCKKFVASSTLNKIEKVIFLSWKLWIILFVIRQCGFLLLNPDQLVQNHEIGISKSLPINGWSQDSAMNIQCFKKNILTVFIVLVDVFLFWFHLVLLRKYYTYFVLLCKDKVSGTLIYTFAFETIKSAPNAYRICNDDVKFSHYFYKIVIMRPGFFKL